MITVQSHEKLPLPEWIAFSPTDAARLLGISRATIFALLARSKLKSFKIGLDTMIETGELKRYVATLRQAELMPPIDYT